MATYHLSLKNGKTGTAKQHADYILREGRFSSGRRAEELVYKNANLPHWAMSASDFFAHADKYERTNGRAYSEFEIALPNELTHEENQKLVNDFVGKHIGNNKVWAYAIHSKPATFDDDEEQIHAHIMFCERVVEDGMTKAKSPSKFFKRYNGKSPDNSGYKKDERFTSSDARDSIKKIRQSWEDMVNTEYTSRRINKTVSCKTLKVQRDLAAAAGDNDLADFFDREPQEHLGPALAYKTKKIIEENGYDQENIDNTLDKIYQMSVKAFGVIIDKIQKARKAAELKYKKQIELERKEKEYSEKRFAELTMSGEIIRKDFVKLLGSVNNQIKYNESAIIRIEKTITPIDQMPSKVLNIMTSGKFEKLQKEGEAIISLKTRLKEILSLYGPKESMPNNIRAEYNEKGRSYRILKADYKKQDAEIHSFISSEAGDKWYKKLIKEMLEQSKDMEDQKLNLLKLNNEYRELRKEIIEVGRKINPHLHYRMKSKYRAPELGNGASAIFDARNDINNLLRNIINAGKENIRRNKMTVSLNSRKSSEWDM
ncbi:43 kDa relaxation protein [Phascolarctobacterium succinatutens CAG:287]|uniref:43 kDa relaxation protein n=1 Tax=Phascolarctobacterium succinatutens CAG:287 TaxID=1263101 RepID=R6WTG0_9FIRM|nr:MobA/MobL family protein [Phascolarctobacterium succinatutens]CDD10244.1 43 kDa relaxation protein [Phascolarctobacterium succinatutens CAG:287]